MLFFPRETYPTDRVRLNSLFGKELLARGHAIDLVMQARDASVRVGRHGFSGRSIWVGPTDDGDGPLRRVRKNVLGVLHDLRWLWRARRDQYDCILVSDKYLLAAIACVVARARGLRFLFWMTFPYHDAQATLGSEGIGRYPWLALLRGKGTAHVLYRWILPRSDHVFVQSERMADDFHSHGVSRDKLTPIATGIDLEGIEPVARVGRPPHEPLTIAYLGTLVRERRLEVLVDMMAELERRGVDARLLLIGDGAAPDDRRVLQERAAERGVEGRVRITGFLPRPVALDLVRGADIGISPFHPSPILDVASPTKLIEYMALGVPAVANVHPDQSVVLRESRAGVCVPWGARHFARAIGWLAGRSGAELQAMGERGKAWVVRHRSYGSIADEFERGCRRALSGVAATAYDGGRD